MKYRVAWVRLKDFEEKAYLAVAGTPFYCIRGNYSCEASQ